VFTWLDQRVSAAGSGTDIIKGIRTFDSVAYEAEEKLGIHPGSYDFYDQYGKVEVGEDLQRAMKLCHDEECVLEVREHKHFQRIRELTSENGEMKGRLNKIESLLAQAERDVDYKIEVAKDELRKDMSKTERKISDEIQPAISGLLEFKMTQTRVMDKIQQKLAGIDLNELREISSLARTVKEEVKNCLLRVDRVETDFNKQKAQVQKDVENALKELKDLHRYIHGKIDMLIETDGDLRRDVQLTTERLAVANDDHRLLQEEVKRLSNQCAGALEESEELRDLLGTVREDNKYIRRETGAMVTRVNCLEGQAMSASWEGFAPGVLYFRHWHHLAHGADVQLNADLSVSTGRGFMAATGVVLGSDEGLACADGPCRRFGSSGAFASYFEVEVDEVCSAPKGAGGFYVGFSIQSADEIARHPKKEFDGWLMGGDSKALVCRAGIDGTDFDPHAIPDTFQPGGVPTGAVDAAADAMSILRHALPPKPKGEVRSISSQWQSQALQMGDRVGVLLRLLRDGGAKMKISVNGQIKGEHHFDDAPPAMAIGFLTPVIRLAGTGKGAKIHAGLVPNSRILADN
jgi:hypothetical protein